MAYTSPIHPDNILITDANYHAYCGLPQVGYGYVPRDWLRYPEGTFAAPFPLPTIPRYEWTDRIEALDKTDGWPKDSKFLSGFDSLNQGNTNYCWINAPIQGMHYARASVGLKHIPLSPASVGAKIKNFRNVGGWGSEGLEYLIKHGAVPQSLWPANAIDRRYDTPEADAARADYMATEWWEMRNRDFSQLVSSLIYGFAVPIGLNWWSHEVLACRVYAVGSDEYEIDIDNSWGTNWGDNGHGRLSQSKATADDQLAIRTTPHNE